MRGTLLIFHPQQGEPEVKAVDFAPLSELERLEVLKNAIGGGYIEAVPYFQTIDHNGQRHHCVAFCDEDGKRKELPYNPIATAWWDIAMSLAAGHSCQPDYLVGQVAVVFGDREFMAAL